MKAKIKTSLLEYDLTLEEAKLFKAAVTEKRTAYFVDVAVEFTEEERAILNKYKLWQTPIWTHEIGLDPQSQISDEKLRKLGVSTDRHFSTRTIQDLVPTTDPYPKSRSRFETLVGALNFEGELKTKYLPTLRQIIDGAQRVIDKIQSLEL